MSNNDYIVEAVKGEPNSLTSIAFNTGVVLERQRIIKLLGENLFTCGTPVMDRDELIALIQGENK
jgi:hypothetical protein